MKTVRAIYRRETRVYSHSEISLLKAREDQGVPLDPLLLKGRPKLHMLKVKIKRMVLWEGHLMEGWIGMMENDKWSTPIDQ